MKLFVFVILVVAVNLNSAQNANEGSCDSLGICDEEEHHLWAEEEPSEDEEQEGIIRADDIVLEYFKKNGVSLSKFDLSFLLHFFDEDHDGSVDAEDLATFQKIEKDEFNIVFKVMKAFDDLDKDDNGQLSPEEMEAVVEAVDKEKKLLSISEYFKILSKIGRGVGNALRPFDGLSYLSPNEVKRIVTGAVRLFQEKDQDGSGGLNMEEYLNQIDRPTNKHAQTMSQEQKEAIFGLIDKDSNGEISFAEFQAVIPQNPPNIDRDLEKLFDAADVDKDGFWSEEEFSEHLKAMVSKAGAPEPSAGEVEDAFNKLDKDEDGRISKQEMKGIQKEIEQIQTDKATQGFKEMDADGNGLLSRDELQGMVKLMEERSGQKVDVDSLIQFLDKNGNSVIELDEIEAMVKRLTPQSRIKP